jgi:hypothetical protein
MTENNNCEEHQRIKTYTTTQLITKLRELFDPFPTAIHVLFKIDSLKKSIIDVCYIRPLLYVFDVNKSRKIISAKEMNSKLNHEVVFLNLRKGIDGKIKQLKYECFAINIETVIRKHEEWDYYPTTISFINDKSLKDRLQKADEDVLEYSEFKL